MITNEGQLALLKYMTGENPRWAGGIVVGVGTEEATLDDTRLQFQIGEAPVDLLIHDYATKTVTIKGTLPVNVAGTISEIGIVTNNVEAGINSSRLLSSFDNNLELLTGSTPDATYTRIGSESARVNTTDEAILIVDNIDMDLSAYESTDQFALAYEQVGVGVAGITVVLETDEDNYYTVDLNVPGAGYQILTFDKSSFSAVGQPRWELITRMLFTVTAGGTAIVHFDGFRINTEDTSLFVARENIDFADYVVKDNSQELDIEITLVFDFGT